MDAERASESAEPARDPDASPRPALASPRRRLAKLFVLVVGLGVALWFGSKAPREQHVRLVLGDYAAAVQGIELTYIGDNGEAAREARFAFDESGAPRVLAHEPKLPDGDYRLKIELETREGRRSTERRVTLGGGSTQLDVGDLFRAGVPARAPAQRP